MNILLIGNGFDLAHGLPTKYTDFLIFCKMILRFIEINEIIIPLNNENKCAEKWINSNKSLCFIDLGRLHKKFCDECPSELSKRDNSVYFDILNNYLIPTFYTDNVDYKLLKELLYLINGNFWVMYFLDNPMYQKENWIDFENEISQVIQSLDNDMQSLDGERVGLDNIVYELSNKSLKEKYSRYVEAIQFVGIVATDTYAAKGITYREIRDTLLIDSNKLIRAFEIYLTEYIEKINVNVISPDIREIVSFRKEYSEGNIKTRETIYNKIMSFNYTNTYEKIYLKDCTTNLSKTIDYIHGKANINNSIESNNMVLGIDEYLPEDRKDRDIEFIAFKKYFQRIHKETGCKYKEWLDEINENFNRGVMSDEQYLKYALAKQEYHLYVFGHSLDVTDKNILRELILTRGLFTTIYYRNLDQKGQQITNLVKVIGQNELIKRTGGGSSRTIEFKLQQPMENIK